MINDLLLLSFLVGNDFLPHSPALAIDEGGLDLLFNNYKVLCCTQPLQSVAVMV